MAIRIEDGKGYVIEVNESYGTFKGAGLVICRTNSKPEVWVTVLIYRCADRSGVFSNLRNYVKVEFKPENFVEETTVDVVPRRSREDRSRPRRRG